VSYDGTNGANFAIKTATDAPTMSASKYIFFGKVTVVTQAAPGAGIVSSFILQSDDLDEIDWEWIGSETGEVETNFFGKGNTTSYNRATYVNVADATTTFHTYVIDWTAARIIWSIDGTAVRTLDYADPLALGGKNYPQTPMIVKLGNWVGCASAAAAAAAATEGTCEWAQGPADFSDEPFNMYVQSVTIEDYGCATSYRYGDESGDWQSIVSIGGCSDSSSSSSSDASTSASSTSSTSSGSSSSSSSTASTSSSTTSSTVSTAAPTTSSAANTTSTTASTAASNSTSTTGTGSATTSSTSATTTPNAANGLKPQHSYGVLDFAVVAIGLGLGFLVM
jgi:beta-glucanase (GH16 family)